MTLPGEKRGDSRRGLLARVGTGALVVPLIAGRTAATQADRELRVSVEAGEGDSDNWRQRDYLTDEFRARIAVQDASGRSVTYLVTVLDPTGEFMEPRCGVEEVRSSEGVLYSSDLWYPTGGLLGIGEWETGEYRLLATVVDSDGAFGEAVSDPVEIDPT